MRKWILRGAAALAVLLLGLGVAGWYLARRVEPFVLKIGARRDIVCARVETAEGIHGWGEGTTPPNVAPVVAQLAEEIGYRAVDVKSHENPEELLLPTEWMLVSKNAAVFENETVKVHAQPIPSRAGLRPSRVPQGHTRPSP